MIFCSQVQSEIGLLSTQLRNIERRMLRAVRERNTRSLAATGLPFLLESTYRAIFALLDDLAIARAVIDQCPTLLTAGPLLFAANSLALRAILAFNQMCVESRYVQRKPNFVSLIIKLLKQFDPLTLINKFSFICIHAVNILWSLFATLKKRPCL